MMIMYTTLSYASFVILITVVLYATILCDLCFGKIFLCSDSGNFSQNGTTVFVSEGQTARLSYCVDSDYQVQASIPLKYSEKQGGIFPQLSEDRINVQIERNRPNAIINIEIYNVMNSDFLDQFEVRVFNDKLPKNESLQLWFQLRKEDDMWLCYGSPATVQSFILIEAQIREPASFSFCVESGKTFSPSVLIYHLNYDTNLYTNHPSENDTVRANVILDKNRIKVDVTISEVKQSDFEYPFRATVNIEDSFNSKTLKFLLIPKGSTSSDAPQCLPEINSECAVGWHSVDDRRCLIVRPLYGYQIVPPDCKYLGGTVPTVIEIFELRSCLLYLLENFTMKSVMSKQQVTINVQTRDVDRSSRSDFIVACVDDKLHLITQEGLLDGQTTGQTENGRENSTREGLLDGQTTGQTESGRENTSQHDSPQPNTERFDKGVIYGGAIGGVLSVVLLTLIVVFLCRKVLSKTRSNEVNTSVFNMHGRHHRRQRVPDCDTAPSDLPGYLPISLSPYEEIREDLRQSSNEGSRNNSSHSLYEEIRDVPTHSSYEELSNDFSHSQNEETRDNLQHSKYVNVPENLSCQQKERTKSEPQQTQYVETAEDHSHTPCEEFQDVVSSICPYIDIGNVKAGAPDNIH